MILYGRRTVAMVMVVNKDNNLKPSLVSTEISMLLALGWGIGESSLKFCFVVVFVVVVQ